MDITVRHLNKRFADRQVLSDFSAVFPEGKLSCIMGPSGGGKTTLLNLLMGLVKPDSGVIEGVPARKSAVFQEDRLCESFSAVSNIRLVCAKSVGTETIIDHLKTIGIDESLKKPVGDFSGGMKRRVAIVRALLAGWDVLFLDEPFKGLDGETKAAVMKYVSDLTAGKTVIMVTHDPSEVVQLGDSLLMLGGAGS